MSDIKESAKIHKVPHPKTHKVQFFSYIQFSGPGSGEFYLVYLGVNSILTFARLK